jgi:hypothetical protein
VAAIDGSKFKAVNARDKNFTRDKLQKRMEQVEASIERYGGAGDGGPSGSRVGGSQVGAAEGQDRLPARPDAQVQGA